MNYQGILSEDEKERFIRQIMLPDIGEEGQISLRSKRILVVGAGGLGSSLLYHLVAAGIGHIGIVDFDTISLSNLQRQILYTEEDLGANKAIVAKNRLQRLNSSCIISAYSERFSEKNALKIAQNHDLIIDGCDNLSTRYLMDATSESLGIPYLYGAVDSWGGQVSLFHHKGSGSYRSLFPQKDIKAEERIVPVLGAAVGVISSIMATEAIKTLLDLPTTLAGRLLRFDAKSLQFDLFSIQI